MSGAARIARMRKEERVRAVRELHIEHVVPTVLVAIAATVLFGFAVAKGGKMGFGFGIFAILVLAGDWILFKLHSKNIKHMLDDVVRLEQG